MNNRLMITVATAALIAGTGFVNAQGTGGGREGGGREGGGAGMQQSAPSSPSGGAAGQEGSTGMKSGQAEERGGAAKSGSMKPGEKSAQTGEKSPAQEKSAQDTKGDTKGDHSKGMSTQNEKGAPGKDMKAEDRNGNMKAEGRENNTTAGAKEGERAQTTGQAGAGGKLNTEQRTKITTVIRNEHVSPVTNINFAISIGTRVPRDVGFRPLPTEIVTIYPDWRGYEFFLVRDQIVVVDPRTLEIVAVLDA